MASTIQNRARHLLVLPLSLERRGAAATPEREAARAAFWGALLERVRALPGVEGAALAQQLPIGESRLSLHHRSFALRECSLELTQGPLELGNFSTLGGRGRTRERRARRRDDRLDRLAGRGGSLGQGERRAGRSGRSPTEG